ncbi:DUF2326 domain-containing protein [Photorhabdus laumondii subsp. laumondii]|uniref:Photorhabdus luminescens subsp. laumondii TTO1 complete genome segment 12/17 n=2 Tax=Photorhabdus laumondii subsp. laumondii TaxID=141679 RepID=Q7N233_PHOLL|nr:MULTISPECIES: DUF2326 domain-containing protein [Photorhabdus]AWK42964.1 hypothetical protein A4R40_16355 [Photorhabdus laumondii subsp. laumondii]AXG43730.1 DUF2326 domain-containing protein [Photorhabdus laumondii subsp. laumondii]AXG48280.1 DUF2326 domain-containing protein [Photorhabdus laumondii subsp. laumondii]MCC8384571.1 DUF2326 domain-containing protein [Photorhabdus laumondii]MCC8388973.1 DUF2326 domain-containing protein [Photorhabdus laumondii]
MKLSKIYSNKPSLFEPIAFHEGLNVIYGEIRLPENKEKDTHNLGKSTLGRVIDFALLSRRNTDFFLFKHPDIFNQFVFFLEIELKDSSFLTIRRDVAQPSKICFKKHQEKNQDYSLLPTDQWDHEDVSFDKAKELLDSLLDLSVIKPWSYRNSLGYLIRSQDDYSDVFQLRKFRSKDASWKPYLSHILGFNAELIKEHYKKEKALEEKQTTEKAVKKELGGSLEDISKVEGILLLKKKDAEKKQELLDAFDFRQQDKEKTKVLVEEIDEEIASLNQERYSLNQNRKKILKSLEEDKVLFNTEEAEKLFNEAGVLFSGQIKKDFEQLLGFNKAITEERFGYLTEEKSEIEAKLRIINTRLNELGTRRSKSLSFLSDTEVFSKYKILSRELVSLRADIETLERQKAHLHKLQELRTEIRSLSEECSHLQSKIENNVESQNSDQASIFSQIRLYFSEIVDTVISRKALLSVSPNREGHLQFKAEILDESGNATSADLGHTYRKLLCIAFDLAVLRVHKGEKFPHFAFHDGVFESLDNRKKENLLAILRDYVELGIQSVITLIDSDLPTRSPKELPVFDSTEIVLQLHDEGESGRLFKLKTW